MSELVEKTKSVRERPELSEAGQIDVKVENEGLRSLITESVNKENVQLHTEADLGNTSDPVGNFGQDASQEITMDLDVPSESQMNVDTQAGSVNQLGTDSKPKAVAVTKNGKEGKLGNGKKENSNRLLEKDTVEDEKNQHNETPLTVKQEGMDGNYSNQVEGSSQSFSFYSSYGEGDDSGTEEEQNAFMKELENFFKERSLEFKPPKFYGEGLNCLKLWRAVTRLGGYDQVTTCKLWRQVGESFKPPKTCTTVSWSFRCFYEKALLEYEKHKVRAGELQVPISSLSEPMSVDSQAGGNHASGSGRARRDAAARAMQGWHSQRLLGNGEVGDPVIKDKVPASLMKKDKPLKSLGAFKRKKSSSLERAAKVAGPKFVKSQVDLMVVDVGPRADWVKINVRRTKDCFEVYALVPGLLREEVHVQSDPAGRLIISGNPEQPDNPWGVTPFKKVVTLPSRIDPHQTSAVVTLHGQLFVRAPYEQKAGLQLPG